MSCTGKSYHVDGFDGKKFLETYFSGTNNIFVDDFVKFPVQKIFNIVNSVDPGDAIKGGYVIDISLGPLVQHLYSVCGFFKGITLLRFSESCITELRKWLDSHTEAYDWSYISSLVQNLQGCSQEWEASEKQLKSAIKQVVRCDVDKANLTDPVVLPQADCVITAWLLDVSANEEQYMSLLRKILNVVKPGGFFLLIGVLNGTYFRVGQDEMHMFKHDEEYEKNALTKAGFTVTHCEVLERKAVSDLTDYKEISIIVARKNK